MGDGFYVISVMTRMEINVFFTLVGVLGKSSIIIQQI